MRQFLLGLLLGVLIVPLGVLAYFRLGSPPVTPADPLLPFEKQIVGVPLHARIQREMPRAVPVPADEAAYLAGAGLYREHCAACHGLPERPVAFARTMFPRAPQLFKRHGDHVGVSDDEPGQTYWIAKNGIRLTGMPGFKDLLSETQLWQVTLLLAHADKLPPSAQQQLAAK